MSACPHGPATAAAKPSEVTNAARICRLIEPLCVRRSCPIFSGFVSPFQYPVLQDTTVDIAEPDWMFAVGAHPEVPGDLDYVHGMIIKMGIARQTLTRLHRLWLIREVADAGRWQCSRGPRAAHTDAWCSPPGCRIAHKLRRHIRAA